MATMSTPAYHKLNKARTYGRNHRKPTYDLTQLDDEDELALKDPTPPHETLPVHYGRTKNTPIAQPTSKARQTKDKSNVDAFDVPTSDEEADSVLERPLPPPRLASKRSLLQGDMESDAPLAPWERKKIRLSDDEDASILKPKQGYASSSQRVGRAKPVARAEVPSSVSSPGASSGSKATSLRERNASSRLGSARTDAPLTAAAKLAARRKHTVAGAAPNKKQPSGSAGKVTNEISSMQDPGGHGDADARSKRTKQPERLDKFPHQDQQIVPKTTKAPVPSSVFDLPDLHSDKVVGKEKQAKKSVRPGTGLQHKSRPMTQAATAYQADVSMVVEPPTTPQETGVDSPDAGTKAGMMTPKQAQIWSNLLESDTMPQSPSVLPMEDLEIENHKVPMTAAEHQSRTKPMKQQASITHRKTRLVDHLKASAPSPSESEASDSDVEMEEEDEHQTNIPHDELTVEPVSIQGAKAAGEPASFSKPKPVIDTSEGGPKITYGKVRSYLADDSIEEGLLDSLPTSIPERLPATSRRTFKGVTAPQSSVFDLDDSGDDSGAGNLKSIHELRASGRNKRLAQDIEALMADIDDWSLTNRSRRRSALLDLANKMCDKGFTDRLFAQGAEQRIIRQSTLEPDEVSEFALAAVMVLAILAEPPEHVIWSFERSSLLSRFVAKLPCSNNVRKLAKERKNNLAKSAQASLLEFAQRLQTLDGLWAGGGPDSISTSLLSLKFLDLLISRLRRLGAQNELLDGTQIALVFEMLEPNSASTPETSLAVSILESLSTLATTHEWPARQFGRLADLLSNVLSNTLPSTRHTAFLALRLCLNLTNDDRFSHNEPFITPSLVGSLLCTMKDGFTALKTTDSTGDREAWAMTLDSVVLTTGIMINLAEHDVSACKLAAVDCDGENVKSLVQIFKNGQKSMLEAESVEESTSNVAFGYLAVMLANLCADEAARRAVASELALHDHDPDAGEVGLGVLLRAVEEFVLQHQKVDMMGSQGQELGDAGDGKEVWGAFTERLQRVLDRFRLVAQA